MRRTILIISSSLFLICAGLWVGAIVGVGALAAPAAFQQLAGITRGDGPAAGLVVGAALARLNAVSMVFLSIMLIAAVFELFYRKRRSTLHILGARAAVVMVGMLLAFYLSLVMLPAMQAPGALKNTESFLRMHVQYRGIASLQALLGVLAIVLTSAANIGPRRDGGHPRVDPD